MVFCLGTQSVILRNTQDSEPVSVEYDGKIYQVRYPSFLTSLNVLVKKEFDKKVSKRKVKGLKVQ